MMLCGAPGVDWGVAVSRCYARGMCRSVRRLLLTLLLILLLASVIDAIAEGVDARGGLIGTALCVLALVLELRLGQG